MPAGGGAFGSGERPAQHRPAIVEDAAFGFEAFAPSVLMRLAHDGAAKGGEVRRKTALQGDALPVVPLEKRRAVVGRDGWRIHGFEKMCQVWGKFF